jgi:hypothetical protein
MIDSEILHAMRITAARDIEAVRDKTCTLNDTRHAGKNKPHNFAIENMDTMASAVVLWYATQSCPASKSRGDGRNAESKTIEPIVCFKGCRTVLPRT